MGVRDVKRLAAALGFPFRPVAIDGDFFERLYARQIARFGIAERTAQERICEMRALGYPVVRAPRGGRGQPPWAVRAEDYAARLGVDVADVIDAARAA